eukprot:466145_1
MLTRLQLSLSELLTGIATGILGVCALVWVILHTHRMYLDLCTTERKSVQHRRSAPAIDSMYKLMSCITTSGVIAWALAAIFNMSASNVSISGTDCMGLTISITISTQLAKAFTFLSYILRIHQCYSMTLFGYNSKNLTYIAIYILIINTIIIFAIMIGMAFGEPKFIDQDNKFPFFCIGTLHGMFNIIISAVVICNDLALTIGSISAFILPINQMVNSLKEENDTQHHKLFYVGYKYTLIVTSASLTSLIYLPLKMIIRGGATIQILSSIDFTINYFCLMLMTPYYPNYYERLCCLCFYFYNPRKQQVEHTQQVQHTRQVEHTTASKETEEKIQVMQQKIDEDATTMIEENIHMSNNEESEEKYSKPIHLPEVSDSYDDISVADENISVSNEHTNPGPIRLHKGSHSYDTKGRKIRPLGDRRQRYNEDIKLTRMSKENDKYEQQIYSVDFLNTDQSSEEVEMEEKYHQHIELHVHDVKKKSSFEQFQSVELATKHVFD